MILHPLTQKKGPNIAFRSNLAPEAPLPSRQSVGACKMIPAEMRFADSFPSSQRLERNPAWRPRCL